MIRKMKTIVATMLAMSFLLFQGMSIAHADDEAFVPAYESVDPNFQPYDQRKFTTYHQGRKYYTSGKKNGFRVNENNEESTDETIGIVFFIMAPAALIYMNLVGWWE